MGDTIRHSLLCLEWILFSFFQSFNVFYIDVSLFSHILQQLTIQSQSKLGDTLLSSCAPNVGVQDFGELTAINNIGRTRRHARSKKKNSFSVEVS